VSEIRSVSVHLDADVAGYIAKMRLAGAETDKAFSSSSRSIDTTNRSLDRTGTSLGKVDAEARKVDTSMQRVGSRMDTAAKSQDRFTGGTRILLNTLVALGPAAIPIAAVAIPAVAGLTQGLGAAAIGLGVTKLAFHGVGTALTAFNKAALDPTTANIEAARKAMDKLPPSAQRLVLTLHQMGPELDKLRQAAAGGLAVGVTSGLHSLERDLPLAQHLIGGVSSELGNLAVQAGRSLAGPEWRGFIRTVGHEAPVALDDMGHSLGSVVHGLAQLYLAFGPSLGSVDQGVVRVSADFDRWASSLGKTQGFQDFMDYLAVNGPKVLNLLGATADALVHIVQAAAPLGGVTLDALTLIVKVLDEIAKSPLGTPLIELAQLGAILHLTSNLFGVMGVNAKIGFTGITTGAKTAEAEVSGLRAEAQLAGSTLRTLGSNASRYFTSGTLMSQGVSRQGLAAVGKSAALGAGVVAIASGLPQRLGLANTATLTLAGSLAGPLGAALGGAVGLTMDLAHTNDSLVQSIRQVDQAMNGSGVTVDFARQSAAIADLQANTNSYVSSIRDAWIPGGSHNPLTLTTEGLTALGDLFTHTSSEAQNAADEALRTYAANVTAFTAIHDKLLGGQSNPAVSSRVGGLPMQELAQTALRAQPAMLALGISVDDLNRAARDGSLPQLVKQIVAWTNHANSAKGRTDAVANAFANLSDQSLTADQRIQALQSSLSALLDPKLNVSAAADTWRQGLNDLDKALAHSTKSLHGQSDAAIQNRTAIRQQVTNLEALINAEAAAGDSPAHMTAQLKQQRQALIDAGHAAGISRADMKAYLDTLGLTPKLVRTIIKALDQATPVVNNVRSQLEGLDGRVFSATIKVTRVGAGIPSTGGISLLGNAEGGTIPGSRHPYGDKVIIAAAPGEEVISNRHGEADRFRRDRALGRIPAYADGGTVTHVTRTVGGQPVDPVAKHLNDELHKMRQNLAGVNKELQAEQAHRQNLMQAEKQLESTVASNFRSQLFGVTPDAGIWGAGASTDPRRILRGDIRDARTYTRDIRRLRGRGLRGGALAEVTTLADAEQALGLPRGELRDISRLYQIRQRASQAAGAVAGDLRYGAQLAAANAQLRHIHAEIKHGNAELHHLRAEQHQHAKTVGKAAGDVVNNAAKTARRRGRPGP
jgi:hypothetical protein